MDLEDEKQLELLKATSRFYTEGANAEAIFGRPVSDIERHMFRIGANLARNLKNDAIPFISFLNRIAFSSLNNSDDAEFVADDFALASAHRSLWNAATSAIRNGELVVRDALTMVPVNGSKDVDEWCGADWPIINQYSANIVVKIIDARRWLDEIGVPIPEHLLPSPDWVDEENEVSDSAENKPKKSKRTPPEFASALGELIAEVEKRAMKKNCEFSTTAMPGRKIDFQKIANLLDARLRHTPSTFSDYLKGICKFNKGARETDFYMNLFPELFSK